MIDRSSTSRIQLSEDNLKAHDATFPKGDAQFHMNLIREERALAAEEEAYHYMYGGSSDFEDANMRIVIGEAGKQEKPCSEVLKLYGGSPACSETPMSRFVTMSPAQDAQPWMSKQVMHEMGVGLGDLETLDLRKLATEMVGNGGPANATREVSIGSPRPSSDTLSASQLRDIRNARREDRPRLRQQARVRRRSGQDEGGPSK